MAFTFSEIPASIISDPERSTPVITSADIARQTATFLADGGRVQALPNGLGRSSADPYSARPAHDPLTGHILSWPSRQVVNGRCLVRLPAMQKMTGLSSTKLRKMSAQPAHSFPRAIRGMRPMAWCEKEVQAWIDDQG